MNYDGPPAEIADFARQLIKFQLATHGQKDDFLSAANQVCLKLRGPIGNLAGSYGFRSLLMRALTVARLHNKALNLIQVKSDGALDGLNKIPAEESAEAGISLVAQLIALLVTFLGESLTLQLIKEQWPDLPGLGLEGNQTT